MMNNNSFEIQNQIRQTALQNHENIKNLKQWEIDMKQKELEMKKQLEQEQANEENQKPPIRSKLEDFQKFAANEGLQKMKSMSIDDGDNKVIEEQSDAEARRREAIEFKDKGNALVKKKEHEAAIKMYTRAIELCDDDSVFFSNRSQCYLSLEKFKESIDDATRAIELDPKSTKSFYRRMVAYEKLGEDYKALQSCRQWLDLAPEDQSAKNSYDRIHNRISETEKKKDKEKIRWSRLDSKAKTAEFVMRPPHLRSKRPLKSVPISLRKAASPIPEAVIDRIFGNNTGETVPEPETNSKLFKPSFLIAPKAEKPLVIETPTPIIEDKQKLDETNEILKAAEIKKEESKTPTLDELEAQKSHLVVIPTSSPQFSVVWRELNDVNRFLYLKHIIDNNASVGKLIGSQMNSEMLSEIIEIVHKFFPTYNVPCVPLLSDLRKNPEISVLVMFLEPEEKKMLSELLSSASSQGDNETNNLILEVKKFFEL